MADTPRANPPDVSQPAPTLAAPSEPPRDAPQPPKPFKERTPPKRDSSPQPLDKTSNPTFKIPLLDDYEYGRMYGRMDSDFFVREHTMRVDNQTTLSSAVYNVLAELVTWPLPITQDEFIRMWKTLMLKRIQDVFESEKSRRSDHFVRLVRNIPLPAPLGDLLHSIGYFHSTKTGYLHHVVQPARASTPETFWTVDPAITASWINTMNRLSHIYTMKEFPTMSQCEGRSMLLTTVSAWNTPMRSVNSFTNETYMTDGFIHAMNNQLYEADPIITFANSHLIMTNAFEHTSVRQQYVYSYAIDHLS